MPAPANPLKKALSEGRQQFGCWLGLADAYVTEVSATAGFDWLLIDGEHAPNDLRSTLAQLQVVEGSGSHPLVRVPVGETWMIKQVLDAGAQSLVVPMVESAEQAVELVRATRYPPEGVRGVGSSLARASRFAGIPDYITTANDEICLLVQVESRAGLAALDDILTVDGVDGVFIGPADLAADMGFPGKTGTPQVKEAVLDAIRRIAAAGRAPGVLATDPQFIEDCREAGATFLGVGIDVTVFAAAMRTLAGKYK